MAQSTRKGALFTPRPSLGLQLHHIYTLSRLKKPFAPPTVTLKEIHDAVPKHLLKRQSSRQPFTFKTYTTYTGNAVKSALYVLRDITFTLLLFKFASLIAPWAEQDFGGYVTSGWQKRLLKATLWLSYWWLQGMVYAGIFCLGMILIAIIRPSHVLIYSDS